MGKTEYERGDMLKLDREDSGESPKAEKRSFGDLSKLGESRKVRSEKWVNDKLDSGKVKVGAFFGKLGGGLKMLYTKTKGLGQEALNVAFAAPEVAGKVYGAGKEAGGAVLDAVGEGATNLKAGIDNKLEQGAQALESTIEGIDRGLDIAGAAVSEAGKAVLRKGAEAWGGLKNKGNEALEFLGDKAAEIIVRADAKLAAYEQSQKRRKFEKLIQQRKVIDQQLAEMGLLGL